MVEIEVLTEYSGRCAHGIALGAVVTTEAAFLGLASGSGDEIHGEVLKDVTHGCEVESQKSEGCGAIVRGACVRGLRCSECGDSDDCE
jgi:hypothetical protein